MYLTELPGAATELVTLAELKQQLGIVHADDDAVLTALILAARQWCEGETGAIFAERSFKATLDYFPAEIRLPVGPVISVDQLDYLDENGALQTLDPLNYYAELTPGRSRIVPAYATSWPLTRQQLGAVEVTFTAGPGLSVEAARQAVTLLVKGAYDASAGFGDVWEDKAVNAARALLSAFYLKEYS